MKRMMILLMSVVGIAWATVWIAPKRVRADGAGSPIYGVTVPDGYRDWKLISVAHEEGSLNDLRAQLGNDIAVKAYRDGTLPFPDGSMIVAMHWDYVASEDNNKVFGQKQSFVAGDLKNIQVMVKDSKKYASTGGWASEILKTALRPTRRNIKPVFRVTNPQRITTSSTHITHIQIVRATLEEGLHMHPLRKLRESGKPTDAQIAELLDENVIFNSPILVRPIQGREIAAAIFAQSSATRGSGTYTTETKLDERTTFLRWVGTMDGHKFESLEIIVDNEQGLIVERTIALRPYPALKLFRDAMYASLKDKLPPDVWEYAAAQEAIATR